MLVNSVRDDFGVGFGREGVAGALQLVAQFFVVFDDAVVDHGQFTTGHIHSVSIGQL